MTLNALSIDVEDWYHPELVRAHVAPAQVLPRVEQATLPVLELLGRYGVRATFFIVGEVAQAAPDLVREIARRGHEIGCHGVSHRTLHDLGPEGLRAELAAYRATMETIGIGEVIGFRAPTFSLDQRSAWAVPILAEAGYRYDSSIFPLRNYMYGVSGAPLAPYRIGAQDVGRADAGGALWEFPMSIWQAGPLKVPVSGGFYLRALPWPLVRGLLGRINAASRPFVIYVHPWEADAGTPRRGELSRLDRWITYVNSASTLPKLERLLRSFSFAPMRDALAAWQEAS